ncbi:hypothetical protein [Rhodococcus qingshengii]|uniref:hypothetical protein n=1 Tax=Rhodococcus qingshengii TaxID=334542 RepID=UPI001E373DA2|nr:hypothetical protein [Rhodococcus qingshengii]UDF20120.1 hypothetical protein LE551_22975 [Rhodococcus qingshengii]
MTMPNHAAVDALAYVANIVEARVQRAIHAIADNTPSARTTADDLYDSNQRALDSLSQLVYDVHDAARAHTTGPTYSDGRPVSSTVEIGNTGGTFTHHWNPDPTKNTRQQFDVFTSTGRTTITLIPPATAHAAFHPYNAPAQPEGPIA